MRWLLEFTTIIAVNSVVQMTLLLVVNSKAVFAFGNRSLLSSRKETGGSPVYCPFIPPVSFIGASATFELCGHRHGKRRKRGTKTTAKQNKAISMSIEDADADYNSDQKGIEGEESEEFLKKDLAELESLEDLLLELEHELEQEEALLMEYQNDGDHEDEDDEDVDELFALLQETQNEDDEDFDGNEEERLQDLLEMLEKTADLDGASETSLSDPSITPTEIGNALPVSSTNSKEITTDSLTSTTSLPSVAAAESLENALLQGVVPADAGVGSGCLPGDYGFDPLNLATKDYPLRVQVFMLQLLPDDEYDEHRGDRQDVDKEPIPQRPTALILRDYREAEIRHGRLAMLAAVFWPLQEMLDRLLLDDDKFGPLVYGPVTLPYFPLLMTLIMMLLGYLDIYAKAIKERDEIGDAFLPGDCFWDPLRMLEGAPQSMKRNMQERELFNGRVAMLAVVVYFLEEATTHLPLISIEGNELLLEPAYQVPFIQRWLDGVIDGVMYPSAVYDMESLSEL